jgi:hypothetical protein
MKTIDRRSLVSRHNPVLREVEWLSPLTVGNGDFAMTVDPTGLQTFGEWYEGNYRAAHPLCTLATWGWHEFSNPYAVTTDNYPVTFFDSHGRAVPYLAQHKDFRDEASFLYANPHRLPLGWLKFRFLRETGWQEAFPCHFSNFRQELDLWSGIIHSRYCLDGHPVYVQTACHPEKDLIAVRVESSLAKRGAVQIALEFPYIANNPWGTGGLFHRDNERHATSQREADKKTIFSRKVDATDYSVCFASSAAGKWDSPRPHYYIFSPECSGESLEFVTLFSPGADNSALPTVAETFAASRRHWEVFWSKGGAVSLGESPDPRAIELERRVILSRYQTAAQCAGSLPPQESGLCHVSFYGRFHLEMHWWHGAHFALWGKPELLERSLSFYQTILEKAKATARRQGYDGARWPKCLGPNGVQPPTLLEATLVWQQPHPIYFAELLYRANPTRETLDRYADLVFATAEFMGSFATWEEKNGRYVLGPPICPAQEWRVKYATAMNPAFELSYWDYGLRAAQSWRERLGLQRVPLWDRVCEKLSRPMQYDGVYSALESQPDTWREYSIDHPTLLAMQGMLPGGDWVDREALRRTLHRVLHDWCWDITWGWDPPMVAMTAARLGEGNLAVDALFLDTPFGNNRPRLNGLCWQGDRYPYLPGNGALLAAVAMMAGGWDGSPDVPAPGFPRDGSWIVSAEGLAPLP